jgi:hypothetical protein
MVILLNGYEEKAMAKIISYRTFALKSWLVIGLFTLTALGFSLANAAPSPDLWPRWQTHVAADTQVVDYSLWDKLLAKYLVTNHPSGINRFRYVEVPAADRQILATFLGSLQQVKVSSLNPNEQKAYWVNLYNALTVKVILDHYPVKSIMDIDISPGLFSNGPWDAKLLVIEGEKVSLNDIEHRILRPIFRDNRLHYALNCASLGCPNLQPKAYTAANTEELLEAGARAYVNSPRGARMEKGSLHVSSIYQWFQVDFGGSSEGVIKHLLQYAEGGLADALRKYHNDLHDDYDWRLNEE